MAGITFFSRAPANAKLVAQDRVRSHRVPGRGICVGGEPVTGRPIGLREVFYVNSSTSALDEPAVAPSPHLRAVPNRYDSRSPGDRANAAMRGIREALTEMRGISDRVQLFDAATRNLCTTCGFDRAVLFSLSGSEMVAQSVYFRGDAAWARRVLEFGSGHGRPQLRDSILEREMVRLRSPQLVLDAQGDPRSSDLMRLATRSESYVAVPLQPTGRVLGFLHADCFTSGRTVDEFDRDLLVTFAEAFGYVLERTLLRSQLAHQRERLIALSLSAERSALELDNAELDMGHAHSQPAPWPAHPGRRTVPDSDSATRSLTAREFEVLRLLVDGATNAGIARQLFIAESTAKAHVKSILRKMGASNRADAVARYLRCDGAGSRRTA